MQPIRLFMTTAVVALAATAAFAAPARASENPDSSVSLVPLNGGRGLIPMVNREPLVIDRKKILENPKKLERAGKLRRVGQAVVLDLSWAVPRASAKRIDIHVVDIEPIPDSESSFEPALARLTKRGTQGGCPDASGAPPKTESRLVCKSAGLTARCEVDLGKSLVFKYAITVETPNGKVCVDPTGVIH